MKKILFAFLFILLSLPFAWTQESTPTLEELRDPALTFEEKEPEHWYSQLLKNPFSKKEQLDYNRFILRGGLSFSAIEIRSDKLIDNSEIDDDEDETKTLGLGINSSISYRWKKWELSITSDFILGPVRDVTFVHHNNSIRGEGHFRLVSFGPQMKYHFPYALYDRANFYIGFGPIWSLQTYVFEKAEATGDFNNKKRISFENYGASFLIGLEEFVPTIKDRPMFIELGYSYMHSYKVSILDATNTAEVITLTEGDSNDFSAHYIIVRLGITIF